MTSLFRTAFGEPAVAISLQVAGEFASEWRTDATLRGERLNLGRRLVPIDGPADAIVVPGRPGVSQLLATLPAREECRPFRSFTDLVHTVWKLPSLQPVIAAHSVPVVLVENSETPAGEFFALGGH